MSVQVGFMHNFSLESEKVRDFYARFWDREIALSDTEFYRWQFILPPNNNSNDHCVVALLDNEIIGVMGLNVRNFLLKGADLKGAELTTWVVNSKFSGLGVGAKMLAFIQSEFQVLIGMGITEQALSVYMRSGFRFLSSIPRFIRVSEITPINTYGYCSKLGEKLVKKWKPKFTDNIFFREVDWMVEPDFEFKINGFGRTREELHWRYSLHPYFDYKSLKVEDDEGVCYVVFREEKCLSFSVMRIMEILGDSTHFSLACKFIDNYLVSNKIEVADFFCTSSQVNKYLLASGWFSVLDDKCVNFPHLFQPIELRSPSTTSLIYWTKIPNVDFYNISDLYFTKSDADFDRPTLSYIRGK